MYNKIRNKVTPESLNGSFFLNFAPDNYQMEQFGLPDLEQEIEIGTSRSSGKGGQHVNTTETRVEIRFNINDSVLLSEHEKTILLLKLHARLSNSGTLRMYSQKERSQAANKEEVLTRFYKLLSVCLKPEKERKATRPGKAVKEKRIKNKKAVSRRKEQRRISESEYFNE